MNITIVYSCEDSSMLVSSIIEDEIFCNSSLNIILSSGPIPHFHFVTRILYTKKIIIAKTTMSGCV